MSGEFLSFQHGDSLHKRLVVPFPVEDLVCFYWWECVHMIGYPRAFDVECATQQSVQNSKPILKV